MYLTNTQYIARNEKRKKLRDIRTELIRGGGGGTTNEIDSETLI